MTKIERGSCYLKLTTVSSGLGSNKSGGTTLIDLSLISELHLRQNKITSVVTSTDDLVLVRENPITIIGLMKKAYTKLGVEPREWLLVGLPLVNEVIQKAMPMDMVEHVIESSSGTVMVIWKRRNECPTIHNMVEIAQLMKKSKATIIG